MNDSERLKEVWKWKEDVYEKTKNMTRAERVIYFNAGLSELSRKTGLKITLKKDGRSVPVS